MWVYVSLNFIKMLVTVTLFIDYSRAGNQLIESLQRGLFVGQILTFLFGILVETGDNIGDGMKMIRSLWKCSQDKMKPKN